MSKRYVELIEQECQHLSIGKLIEALKATKHVDDRGTVKSVYYDFAFLRPTSVDSYRGYYDQLALGYTEKDGAPKVTDLINQLEQAKHGTFTGWKGGEYDMTPTTLIWAANRGESGSQAIVGVKDDGWRCDHMKPVNECPICTAPKEKP